MPRAACPKCSSRRTAPILYGEPPTSVADDERAEKVIIGGCCLDLENPARGCFACGHRWGVFNLATLSGPAAPQPRRRR